MEEGLKSRSRKEWSEDSWRGFLNSVEKADSKKRVTELLDTILSDSEKKLISKRLAALRLIEAGVSYKAIGRKLWMSPSTVSALKKIMYKPAPYQSSRYYATRSRNEKRKNMKGVPPRSILDYWLNFPLPSKTGKGRWRFLNYQG